jgi:hypothetical protein
MTLVPFSMANPAASNLMNHYSDPSELDVTSQSCAYDSRKGFAGDIGEDYFTVEYFYTMTLDGTQLGDTEISYNQPIDFDNLAKDSLHNVVFQVELEIASYLLRQSGEFVRAPCNSARRLMMARKTQEVRNVGLTVGPDDEVVATCESDSPEKLCYWVEGYFQVYTVGTEGNATLSEESILADLKGAMNSGELDDAHPAIIGLSYQDSLPKSTADGATSDKPDEGNGEDTISPSGGGPDAAIIVGASVGAALLVAAVALISRKRRRGQDDQSEFQPSSMDVSEFHMSKEESVVDDTLA